MGLAAFFGFYLLFFSKWKSLANTLLALLLVALSMRIGKAIFYNFVELPLFLKNLGLAANLAAAPLIYFYGKALLSESFKWDNTYFIHFIPAGIYALFCWVIPNATGDVLWKINYSLILMQSYAYVLLSFKTIGQHKGLTHSLILSWYRNLVLGLLAIWLIYGLIFVQVLPYHTAGAVSFSVLMIVLAFIAMNKALVFKGQIPVKYQNSKLSQIDIQKSIKVIKEMIHKERLYLESDLTINRLSDKLDIHPKLISETINRYEGQNFVSFINTYRIEEAKKLLLDTQSNDKIAAIAYNCGFNSLSAFNIAFKSITSYTPSQFRSLK